MKKRKLNITVRDVETGGVKTEKVWMSDFFEYRDEWFGIHLSPPTDFYYEVTHIQTGAAVSGYHQTPDSAKEKAISVMNRHSEAAFKKSISEMLNISGIANSVGDFLKKI